MPVDPALRPFLAGFVEEANTLCTQLITALADWSDSPEKAPAMSGKVARVLHTLKGSAGTLGFEDVVLIAHRLEDLVQPVKKGTGSLPPDGLATLIRGTDLLLERFAALGAGEDRSIEIEAVFPVALHSPVPPPFAEPPPPLPIAPLPPAESPGASPTVESSVSITGRAELRSLQYLIGETERLRELRLRIDEQDRAVGRALEALDSGASARALKDALLGVRRALKSDLSELKEISDGLEGGIKEMSTLPLQSMLPTLQRGVRDLCEKLGKEARLSLVGGELSVDRHVAETVRGALIHLLRNAVDHGIEQPHVRERHGKHRAGALFIRAEQHGNLLFLEVSDDGMGIDPEGVREAARAKGVASDAELDAMKPSQLVDLVFRPSFSTRAETTDISGRGIGLEAVQQQVRELNGTVEVHSVKGQGTRFTLSLPIGRGSAPFLVLRVGDSWLGIPSSGVDKLVRLSPDRLGRDGRNLDLKDGDDLVPLGDLGATLQLREPLVPSPGASVVIVQAQGKRRAYVVDELDGEQELVVRPLPPQLRQLAPYHGAVTLGRGELCLVLRPAWLADAERGTLVAGGRRRALVVDDSMTARALHRSMLEAGGYVVHAASSAEQALGMLAHAPYDVVVADIGMDPVDGYALTAQVRRQPANRMLPIVLVSAHDSPDAKERGLAAGADSFLSKRECVAGRLLAEVADVVSRRGART